MTGHEDMVNSDSGVGGGNGCKALVVMVVAAVFLYVQLHVLRCASQPSSSCSALAQYQNLALDL